MAALYLHIPFCASRCSYCDFYSQCNTSLENSFVAALSSELELRKDEAAQQALDTIYFGGGTPSQLQIQSIEQIFATIAKHYQICPDAEITFEANPDDLNPEYLQGLKQLPINRISMGVQSFDDSELKLLGRRHSAQQVQKAVEGIRAIGIDNISLDLIYGIPGQSLEGWQQSLEQCIALKPKHISAYHLIYEEGTLLSRLRDAGTLTEVEEEHSLRFFDRLIDRLRAAGYEQYEISNFARPSYRSRHNSKYWQGLAYMGLGPSAHSFDGSTIRSYNPPSLQDYIKGLEAGEEIRIFETLSKTDRYNELIMTGLRKSEGIELNELEQTFGKEALQHCLQQAQSFIDRGLLVSSQGRLQLSRRGLFLSDSIMAALFY